MEKGRRDLRDVQRILGNFFFLLYLQRKGNRKKMGPIRYCDMIRQSKDPKVFRYELVRYAKEHGVKPTARDFGTTPKTVRKWLKG